MNYCTCIHIFTPTILTQCKQWRTRVWSHAYIYFNLKLTIYYLHQLPLFPCALKWLCLGRSLRPSWRSVCPVYLLYRCPTWALHHLVGLSWLVTAATAFTQHLARRHRHRSGTGGGLQIIQSHTNYTNAGQKRALPNPHPVHTTAFTEHLAQRM